jgi:hypothetical protein
MFLVYHIVKKNLGRGERTRNLEKSQEVSMIFAKSHKI